MKMTVTASLYFLGKYRPAYWSAKSAVDAFRLAYAALDNCPDRDWFIPRLQQGAAKLRNRDCESVSHEHGCRGVMLAKRPHDPFLDDLTRSLPAYPGLDYSQCVNA
jgi:hypothetical protein